MQKKHNTAIYAIAALLFLGGIGYLLFSGLTEGSVYFLNVAEAKAAEPSKLTNVRLFGTVSPSEISRPQQGPGVLFCLEDKDNRALTIPISYKGAVPDAFKAEAEVIVEGGLRQDGVFHARTLMTKCPSKYQKQNRKS